MSEMTAPVQVKLPTRQHPMIQFIRRLVREKPLGAVGGAIFVLFLFFGIFADVLAPFGMNDTDLRHRL